MNTFARALRLLLAGSLAFACLSAWSDDAAIRRSWDSRHPKGPAIDEITKTPIPGLYELRVGTEILYSDERGEHIVQGELIETKSRTNLTQARIDKISSIDFASHTVQVATEATTSAISTPFTSGSAV